MKIFLEYYYRNCFKKGSILTMEQFYEIYVGVENYHGRTPVSYYKYRTAFYFYFMSVYKFLIRVDWLFHLMFRLGTLRVAPINREKGWYKYVWRKGHRENTQFPNQGVYAFITAIGNSNYGKLSIWAWLKESRKANDLNWFETMD